MKRTLFNLVLLFFATTALAQSQIIGDSTDILWERPNEGSIYGLCFSPNDSLIAVAKVGSINILSAKNGEFLNDLKADRTFWDVTFSPDGRFLASTTDDGFIFVWDTKDWKIIFTYDNKILYTNGFNNLVFSSDSKFLYTTTLSKGITVFETKNWNINKQYKYFPYKTNPQFEGLKNVSSIDLFNDASKMILSAESRTYLYNKAVDNIENHFNGIYGKITNDGKYIATMGFDGQYNKNLLIYDVATGEEIMKVEYPHSWFWFDFSADSKYIVVTSEDASLRIYNIYTKEYSYFFKNNHSSSLSRGRIAHNMQQIVYESGYIFSNKWPINKTSVENTKNDTIIYPNPVKDIIKLSINSNYIKENVTIIDFNGNQISSKSFSFTFTNNLLQIDVRKLFPGMYFLQFSDKYYKFIKE
jgi:hypothetical protein